MKVRLNNQKPIGVIARLEALLAGMILTVSTAYAATVCPMYWTQLQLEAELRNRLAIAQRSHVQRAEPTDARHDRVASAAYCEPFRHDSDACPVRVPISKN